MRRREASAQAQQLPAFEMQMCARLEQQHIQGAAILVTWSVVEWSVCGWAHACTPLAKAPSIHTNKQNFYENKKQQQQKHMRPLKLKLEIFGMASFRFLIQTKINEDKAVRKCKRKICRGGCTNALAIRRCYGIVVKCCAFDFESTNRLRCGGK